MEISKYIDLKSNQPAFNENFQTGNWEHFIRKVSFSILVLQIRKWDQEEGSDLTSHKSSMVKAKCNRQSSESYTSPHPVGPEPVACSVQFCCIHKIALMPVLHESV